MDDKFKIRVEIADKPYRMTIPREEEEKVRKAAKAINEKIAQLKKQYDATAFDYLAMAALQIAIRFVDSEMNDDMAVARKSLEDLDRQLDEYISKNK